METCDRKVYAIYYLTFCHRVRYMGECGSVSRSSVPKLTGLRTLDGTKKNQLNPRRVACGETVPTNYQGWEEIREEDMESISHLPVVLQSSTSNKWT